MKTATSAEAELIDAQEDPIDNFAEVSPKYTNERLRKWSKGGRISGRD